MVGCHNTGISVTIPVVFLLEQTLSGIIDRALEAHQQEEVEDYPLFQGPLNPDTIPVRPQQVQEEQEYGCHDGIQKEGHMGQVFRDGFNPAHTLGVTFG